MPREALTAAGILNFVMLACSASLFSVPVMAPEIAADLGLSTNYIGVYSGLLWTCALLTSYGSGPLIARFGPLGVSQLCMVSCALGLVIAALGTWPAFVLASIFVGLAHGVETPASSQLLARLTPARDQPLVFSLKQTGVQLGGMLSGVLFPFLLLRFGWRGALFCMAGAMVLGAWALQPARRRFDREHFAQRTTGAAKPMTQALRAVWHDPRLFRITIAALAYVAAQVCFNAFLVSYLVHERGVSLAVAGSVLTVGQFGGLLGRVVWGAVSGRIVPAAALLIALGVVMTVGFALLGGIGHLLPLLPLYLLCFAVGLTVSGWNGVFLAEIARLAPRNEVGRITGASFVISGTGLVVGPVLFGVIAGASSAAMAFLLCAASTLTGVACLALRRSS